MGMFDWINFSCPCPVCDTMVTGFQSKDHECMLEKLDIKEVGNFYTSCDMCDAWIEFERNIKGIFQMTHPNYYKFKDIKTKKDMYNNLKNISVDIVDYCVYNLMPIRRIENEQTN